MSRIPATKRRTITILLQSGHEPEHIAERLGLSTKSILDHQRYRTNGAVNLSHPKVRVMLQRWKTEDIPEFVLRTRPIQINPEREGTYPWTYRPSRRNQAPAILRRRQPGTTK